MNEKTTYYLVGNAHLDPVWQWQWQEGSAEAKATIRSALDRMKEFPEFRFCCSSAVVYRWIETFSPEMFAELAERVKEGRFVIVGGMHVQPDCNNPSGEGFARQMLYSQRYFKEKLGKTAKVGYNVDSFGHHANYPQLLKKGGMDSYIFMRPGPHEKEIDSDVFEWLAPDGSSVTTYRILDPYCFQFQTTEGLEERMRYLDRSTKTELSYLPFFYGVGNHGGGPTIRHLTLLEQYREAHPEKTLIYSDLSDFFTRVKKEALPSFKGDLQHHASGCYAAVSHVKRGIRRAEEALGAAERYGVLAKSLCVLPIDKARTEEAWNEICFLHFHDSMGGCSIKEVHDDAAYQYGFALRTAAVQENNALQTLSWAIDTGDREKGLPVVVFNPYGFTAEQVITVNRQAREVTDEAGNAIPIQHTWASSAECYWKRDTSFRAVVPPLGYRVYYLRELYGDLSPDQPENSSVTAALPNAFRTANEHAPAVLENECLRLSFDLHSGYLTSVLDKRTGKEWLSGESAVPIVIDEYYHDTWSHGKNYFTEEIGRFGDAELTAVENGPVRATLKVVSRYGKSTLTVRYTLESGSDRIGIRAVVDWQERHKMLKMAWRMAVESPKALYEIPFGEILRDADGEEEPGLRFTAVLNPQGQGYALLNDGTYSSSVKDSVIYHTILRSPIYGDHGGPRTEESEFSDLGRHDFAAILMPIGEKREEVIRAASLLNKGLSYIIETWHSGRLRERTFGGLHVDADNVILSALKESEDGQGIVLRLYECDGRDTALTVDGPLLPTPLRATIGARSVTTWLLPYQGGAWREVLLTEYSVGED